MYYKGIYPPDREPDRNKFASSTRRSKFTEEVAAAVQVGDLYFAQRSTGGQRYYVQVNPGEHGFPDDDETGGLICVTHKFRLPYEGADKGKWEPYDAVGNLVIRVNTSDGDDLRYEAFRGLEYALAQTSLGRVIGWDGIKSTARELAERFGLDLDHFRSDPAPTFTLDTDPLSMVRKYLLQLLRFYPERGYPGGLGKIGAKVDGVGYAQDAKEYQLLLDGESNGFGEETRRRPLPILSEPVYYLLCGGKDGGRTFRAILDDLKTAVGVKDEDVHVESES